MPFGGEYSRYWDRRYELFSRFDEGIEVDDEGLASVKPEATALEVGRLLEGTVVLDAFCGLGGSAIGIARAGKKVIAVEKVEERLSKAKRNAKIYGVDKRIEFVLGDIFDLFDRLRYDAAYLDPSWGGPSYHNRSVTRFEDLVPDVRGILEWLTSRDFAIAISLPKNFDLGQLTVYERDLVVHWAELRGQRAFMTVFIGRPVRG